MEAQNTTGVHDNKAAESPRYIDGQSFADMIGVGEQTIRRWRCQRRGPAYVRIGGRVRYRVADVDRWLEENTVAA